MPISDADVSSVAAAVPIERGVKFTAYFTDQEPVDGRLTGVDLTASSCRWPSGNPRDLGTLRYWPRTRARLRAESRLTRSPNHWGMMGLPTVYQAAFWAAEGRVEGGAGFEHGTGDVEESVGDRAERLAMAMTSASQFGVFGAAARIVLHGDTGPMVDGVGEAVVAGLSSDDDAALSGPLGDRRDSCQTAQGGVVSSLQGIPGFCEQRGEDGPSHSRQGCEDRRVMLLFLPWLGRLGWHEAGGEAVDPALGVFDLPVEQAGCAGRAKQHGRSRLRPFRRRRAPAAFARVDHGGGVEAADAMAFEQFGDRRLAQTARRVRRRRVQGAINRVTHPELEAARAIGPEIVVPPVGLGILGAWADVPRGTRMRSGTVVLQPQRGADGSVQFLNVSAETGGFTASRLTRVVFTPPQQEDIQSVLELVNKNVSEGETLANGNLKAYKDPLGGVRECDE